MLTSHHRNKSLRRAEDLNFYDIFITFIAFVKERILFSLTALNINSKTSGNRQILATKIDREHPHLPLCKPESHTFDQVRSAPVLRSIPLQKTLKHVGEISGKILE